jgi:DNA-binding LacI/PurR family transcriptional regulator
MVMGVLLEASRRGKEVPREIGIVGLDDASDAAFFGSPLTLIAQDYPMLGRTAMQKLAVLIETNNKAQNSLPTHTVIEPILLARESSSRLNSSRS